MRVIIYNRVSDKDQSNDQQTLACQKYAEARGWEVLETVVEVATTKETRPLKEEVRKRLLRREAEGLVIFRLDRWARNLVEMINDVEALEKAGVLIASLHETIDTSSAMGRAMVQLIGVFAQLERDLHAEATRDRLRALKAMGMKLGRPPGSKDKKKRVRRWKEKPPP